MTATIAIVTATTILDDDDAPLAVTSWNTSARDEPPLPLFPLPEPVRPSLLQSLELLLPLEPFPLLPLFPELPQLGLPLKNRVPVCFSIGK